MNAVGINIYGGGFTVGVRRQKFKVLQHLEEIKLGRDTFTLNFPDIPRQLTDWSAWPVVKDVQLVYANPPCVPWSYASSYSQRTGQIGTKKGKTVVHRFADPLLELTYHTQTHAMKIRPDFFISESVENAYDLGAPHYEPYMKAWMRRGYSVTYFLTDATLHGAPCRRRRFHFIAHRHQLQLPPVPKVERATTVRDAIWDLRKRKLEDEPVFQHWPVNAGQWNKPRYRKWLRKCEPYQVLRRAIPPREEFKGVMPSILCRKQAWDIPAHTVVRFHNMIHPDGERFVTYREGMRLMSYPDDFRVYKHRQIDACDAVIPAVATVLAGMARRTIDKGRKVKRPEFTVVDWRPLGEKLSGKAALEAVRGTR